MLIRIYCAIVDLLWEPGDPRWGFMDRDAERRNGIENSRLWWVSNDINLENQRISRFPGQIIEIQALRILNLDEPSVKNVKNLLNIHKVRLVCRLTIYWIEFMKSKIFIAGYQLRDI